MIEYCTDRRLHVGADDADVVVASAATRWLRKALAVTFCACITRAAHEHGAHGLVLDLGALRRATPPAGVYALHSLKQLPIRRIALVRGGPFMRAFAGAVLTLGRFPSYRFFEDEAEAAPWARGEAAQERS
jgi:hypothetical protein